MLRLDPHYPGALRNLAVSLYESGLYEEARDILSDLAAREPRSASAPHYFGLTLLKRGEAGLALPELRIAVRLQPDNPEGHYALGQTPRRLGRDGEAAEAMPAAGRLRAGRTEKTREKFLEDHAQQLALAGDLDAAADKLREAPAVNGNDRIALNLGMLLVRKGDFDEDIDVPGELARTNPDLPLAHFHLGLASARTRNLPQARESFKTAVRLRLHFPDALFNLGLACAMQGATEEAETHLRASVNQQPDHAASRYYPGLVPRQLGRHAEAEAEMRIARLLDPDLPDDPQAGRSAILGPIFELRHPFRQTPELHRQVLNQDRSVALLSSIDHFEASRLALRAPGSTAHTDLAGFELTRRRSGLPVQLLPWSGIRAGAQRSISHSLVGASIGRACAHGAILLSRGETHGVAPWARVT